MIEIDSGTRVIRIDPGKVESIVASYNSAKLADVFYKGQENPEYSLTTEEALEVMSYCWNPAKCMFASSNKCYWKAQQSQSPARCIRCRIALLHFEKTGTDVREGTHAERKPGCGYATALLIMAGVTMFSIQNNAEAWRQTEKAKAELKSYAQPRVSAVSIRRRTRTK